jgi:pimeloyl-ACP methyl ester carboxylesterase
MLKRRRTVAAVVVVAMVAGLGGGEVSRHVRAARFLSRLAAGEQDACLETALEVSSSRGPVKAKLYRPPGAMPAAGLVLLHGVHRLGIEEPRLQRFARAFASMGVAVLTPQLESLADYQVDPADLEVIGASARALREQLPGRPRVGLMGLSFAGGLALIAAADEAVARDVRWVMAVGAHDDLSRVMRFFATSRIQRPDGTVEALHAHDYGPLVIAYSHPEAFFPEAERAPAREALRLWLAEEYDGTRRALGPLSAPSRAKLEALFDRRVDAVSAELLAALPGFAATADAVSPHRFLSRLRVPVLLLHGAGDNVIPATETRWLARGIPPDELRGMLISEALQHVELHGEPSLGERWALLHFVAGMISLATAE